MVSWTSRALLAIALLCGLTACPRSERTAEPEPRLRPRLSGAAGPVSYQDEVFCVEAPAGWSVVGVGSSDSNLNALDLRSPAGLYARLVLIRESARRAGGPPAPGAFVTQVVENLRRAHAELATQPCEAVLAGHAARGLRYQFQADDLAWEGRVVSYAADGAEVCALGQFPANAPAAADELLSVWRTLRVNTPLKNP